MQVEQKCVVENSESSIKYQRTKSFSFVKLYDRLVSGIVLCTAYAFWGKAILESLVYFTKTRRAGRYVLSEYFVSAESVYVSIPIDIYLFQITLLHICTMPTL